jgi:hypothetical protein
VSNRTKDPKWYIQNRDGHLCLWEWKLSLNKNSFDTENLFFQCLKIIPFIEKLKTMIIALCDQT